ncbi:hypothetical protein H0I23_11535 [Cellulophaga sp. HaHaR_3_176]|uniref:hypothetical protein n=1 Tax=Cellulophaga sp. HaHaR_3_176 TaxID=1942464 RepID=UPI001C1FBB82|nr:hypothetical protein [Cellulophaga sp. HaHaR_3_176]QWX83083.1 hypothetical protein H0I23_11535 [Cellulophaga sp. HaHaR_3_176]
MKPKNKSIIYLICFIACALFYNYFIENENTKNDLKSENFAKIQMIDLENDEENFESESIDDSLN